MCISENVFVHFELGLISYKLKIVIVCINKIYLRSGTSLRLKCVATKMRNIHTHECTQTNTCTESKNFNPCLPCVMKVNNNNNSKILIIIIIM